MSTPTKLSVRVKRATGHGPHGIFPDEDAWAVVEVPGATPSARKTEVGVKQKAALLFSGQELVFELGAESPKEVRVALHGRLPQDADDMIGKGSCNLTGIFGSPHDPSPQVRCSHEEVRVNLEANNGRQTGEMELTLAYS